MDLGKTRIKLGSHKGKSVNFVSIYDFNHTITLSLLEQLVKATNSNQCITVRKNSRVSYLSGANSMDLDPKLW